jgi:hypothetical protein
VGARSKKVVGGGGNVCVRVCDVGTRVLGFVQSLVDSITHVIEKRFLLFLSFPPVGRVSRTLYLAPCISHPVSRTVYLYLAFYRDVTDVPCRCRCLAFYRFHASTCFHLSTVTMTSKILLIA